MGDQVVSPAVSTRPAKDIVLQFLNECYRLTAAIDPQVDLRHIMRIEYFDRFLTTVRTLALTGRLTASWQ